jgi:hypothetical protein
MPTVWFFKDGLKVDEVVSATPPALDRAIMEHLE